MWYPLRYTFYLCRESVDGKKFVGVKVEKKFRETKQKVGISIETKKIFNPLKVGHN